MTSGGSVLLVTPVFTNPPTQGNAARILALGRELKARGFRVEVVHYVLDRHSNEIALAMRREWHAVHEVSSRPHSPMAFPACWGIDDWCPEQLCDVVADLAPSFDAVITNYVWMSRVLERVDGPLKILDTHDLFGDRHIVSKKSGLDPNWYFTSLEEEDKAFARADHVIGIQDAETQEIAHRSAGKAITVGHPIAPWFINNRSSVVKAATFGYFGSGNPWNVRSALAFDATVARWGGVDWALAGTICRANLDLVSRPYVFGVVDAPSDFYRHVECCVNPMAGGTGLKIKTVEALAYGKPMLGTSVAFDGLDPRHACHKLDTIEDVVESALEYKRSPSLQSEVRDASMQLYLRYLYRVRRQYDSLASLIRGRGTNGSFD